MLIIHKSLSVRGSKGLMYSCQFWYAYLLHSGEDKKKNYSTEKERGLLSGNKQTLVGSNVIGEYN